MLQALLWRVLWRRGCCTANDPWPVIYVESCLSGRVVVGIVRTVTVTGLYRVDCVSWRVCGILPSVVCSRVSEGTIDVCLSHCPCGVFGSGLFVWHSSLVGTALYVLLCSLWEDRTRRMVCLSVYLSTVCPSMVAVVCDPCVICLECTAPLQGAMCVTDESFQSVHWWRLTNISFAMCLECTAILFDSDSVSYLSGC